MLLAKNVVYVGLSTSNLGPMLRFWQQDAGLRFDKILPVRRGLDCRQSFLNESQGFASRQQEMGVLGSGQGLISLSGPVSRAARLPRMAAPGAATGIACEFA